MRATGRIYRSKVFMAEDIPVEVAWKSVRNLNLRLGRDSIMRATVPRSATPMAVSRFLENQLPWMRKALARSQERQGIPEMPRAVQGEQITFFGQAYRLHIAEGKPGGMSLLAGTALLTVRPQSTEAARSAALKAASRKLLHEAVEAHFPYVEQQTGLNASSWYIRDMKSLWGSCNVNTRRICLNLRLVQMPLLCLDAVIAHELVHTKIHNHSKDFYGMLTAVWPEWRAAMDVLNGKTTHNVAEYTPMLNV